MTLFLSTKLNPAPAWAKPILPELGLTAVLSSASLIIALPFSMNARGARGARAKLPNGSRPLAGRISGCGFARLQRRILPLRCVASTLCACTRSLTSGSGHRATVLLVCSVWNRWAGNTACERVTGKYSPPKERNAEFHPLPY